MAVQRRTSWQRCSAVVAVLTTVTAVSLADQPGAERSYRGQIGEDDPRLRAEGDRLLLWAKGEPGTSKAEWFDFTGAPIPPEELQFGIGKDRIRAIDDPVFVKPDDPRLMKLPRSVYRFDEWPENVDEIMVIGYVVDGEARAYPTGLLDAHELVNDEIGGKPVTVGW